MVKRNKRIEMEHLKEQEKVETLERRNALLKHRAAYVRNETDQRVGSLSIGQGFMDRHKTDAFSFLCGVHLSIRG